MSEKILAELIQIAGEMVALRFTLPELGSSQAEKVSESFYAMLAIDKSGSMSGGPIRDAKGAAESLVIKFRNAGVPVSVYTFDSYFDEFHSNTAFLREFIKEPYNQIEEKNGHDALIEYIRRIHLGGGTNFVNVLDAMGDYIMKQNLKNVFIVWLTDGKDEGRWDFLSKILQEQNLYYESNGACVVIHCIGFSEGHDANLLTNLASSGTRPGTFQYVPAGGRIPVAVNNVYNLAFEGSTWAKFLTSEESSYRVIIENESGNKKALVYASENDLEDCKVEVHASGQVTTYDIEFTRADYRDVAEIVHLVTAFVASEIASAIEKGFDGALDNLNQLYEIVELAEKRLFGLEIDSKSLRPYKRKQLEPFFIATNELIGVYKNIIKEGRLDNSELAKLNGMANKVFLKRNLKNKIMKETGENMKILDESDEKVDEVVKGFEAENLNKRYFECFLGRGLKCALSSKLWHELVIYGDCLCVTLYVERPQNLVGDAYHVNVKNVNFCFISHDNFIFSKLFETKAGQIIQGERNYIHGSTPQKAKDLIPTLSDDKINGIFPLYLNPDHWKISSLRINQMLGYCINVDVLGFNSNQLLVFPYLIYLQALQQNNELLINLLKETCDQIYIENKDQILPSVYKMLDTYAIDPLYRFEVKDTCVVLCWLSSAVRSGDVTEYKHVLPYILLEEIRRKVPFEPVLSITDLAIKLLAIDLNVYYDKIRDDVMKNEVSFTETFKAAAESQSKGIFPVARVKKPKKTKTFHMVGHKKGQVRGKKIKKPQTTSEDLENIKAQEAAEQEQLENTYKLESNIEFLSEDAQLSIDLISSSLMAEGPLHNISHIFKDLQFPVKTLEDLSLTQNDQKLAFLIQSLGYKKDPYNLAKFNLYTTSFSQEDSINFIKKIYAKSVAKELLLYKSKLVGELEANKGRKNAMVFGSTEDLEEAAGCVYGLKQGSNIFPYFFKAIEENNVPMFYEKLKMLTLGHYKGIKLIFDNSQGPSEFVKWKLGNKKAHKYWEMHKNTIGKDQWIEAFPLKAEYFEHLYSRQAGEFVAYSKPGKNVKDPRHLEGKFMEMDQADESDINKKGKVEQRNIRNVRNSRNPRNCRNRSRPARNRHVSPRRSPYRQRNYVASSPRELYDRYQNRRSRSSSRSFSSGSYSPRSYSRSRSRSLSYSEKSYDS